MNDGALQPILQLLHAPSTHAPPSAQCDHGGSSWRRQCQRTTQQRTSYDATLRDGRRAKAFPMPKGVTNTDAAGADHRAKPVPAVIGGGGGFRPHVARTRLPRRGSSSPCFFYCRRSPARHGHVRPRLITRMFDQDAAGLLAGATEAASKATGYQNGGAPKALLGKKNGGSKDGGDAQLRRRLMEPRVRRSRY